MRRPIALLTALVACAALPAGFVSATTPEPPTSDPAAETAQVDATLATDVAVAEVSAPVADSAPVAGSAPVEGSTPADSAVPPIGEFSGNGNQVIDIGQDVSAMVLVDLSFGGAGESYPNMSIQALDPGLTEVNVYVSSYSFAESTAPITGRYLVNAGSDPETIRYLSVESSGDWTVTVSPVEAAAEWDGSEPLSGIGADVVLFTGAKGLLGYSATPAEGEDAVRLNISSQPLDGGYGELSVYNEGESGTSPISESPVLLEIDSDGTWNVTFAPVG